MSYGMGGGGPDQRAEYENQSDYHKSTPAFSVTENGEFLLTHGSSAQIVKPVKTDKGFQVACTFISFKALEKLYELMGETK